MVIDSETRQEVIAQINDVLKHTREATLILHKACKSEELDTDRLASCLLEVCLATSLLQELIHATLHANGEESVQAKV